MKLTAHFGQHEATERHYSPKEIAELWAVSAKTVIRMFQDQPGVLKIGATGRRTRRDHIMLRIPASILQRVHADRCRKV